MIGAVQAAMLGGSVKAAEKVYATWDPDYLIAETTLSNGNMTCTTSPASSGSVKTTIGKSAGKWAIELITTDLTARVGCFGDATMPWGTTGESMGGDANPSYSIGYRPSQGRQLVNGGTTTIWPSSVSTSDVFGILLDVPNRKCYVAKNGVVDPDASVAIPGTGELFFGCSPDTLNCSITLRSDPATMTYAAEYEAAGYTAGLWE